MPRRRTTKPKSPTDIAAEKRLARQKDFQAVSLPADAVDLASQSDIHITRAGEKRGDQTAKTDSARRLDAFEALRDTLAPGCYDAAHRLERDMLIRRGESDRGTAHGRVDMDRDYARALKMIEAGDRVDAVLGRIGERDAMLLAELIVGHPDRPHWRQGVAYVTGEENPNCQGAAVRAATINLRDAYTAIERKVAA